LVIQHLLKLSIYTDVHLLSLTTESVAWFLVQISTEQIPSDNLYATYKKNLVRRPCNSWGCSDDRSCV